MSILTQPEGFITGMASKMFVVAGPVIVFGTLASVVYGVVLMLIYVLFFTDFFDGEKKRKKNEKKAEASHE